MAVVAVIAILAGLLLGGAGAVRARAARGQAKAEISAIEAGLARYQADMGQYPTEISCLNRTNYNFSPTAYVAASRVLFSNLWGAASFSSRTGAKQYLSVKPSMVSTSGTAHYFLDPWGYAYGYYWSGTNSMYGGSVPDVWSTGGGTTASTTNKWVTSW